jgi:chromosome segregation ATPase
MGVITVERLATAQAFVTKLVEQTKLLFDDIEETARDRERLAAELEHSNSLVGRMTVEARELNDRIKQSEHANNRLIDELNQLDSKLADATARLESISQTARLDGPPNRSDEPTPAATAGLAALKQLSAVNHRPAL